MELTSHILYFNAIVMSIRTHCLNTGIKGIVAQE